MVTIHQENYWEISKGDTVFINSLIAEDQIIILKKGEKIVISRWKSYFCLKKLFSYTFLVKIKIIFNIHYKPQSRTNFIRLRSFKIKLKKTMTQLDVFISCQLGIITLEK